MAAGSAFTMVPQEVTTETPVYNNVESITESQKKEYFNLSATPIAKYSLLFKALTSAERDTLLAHYNDQSGGYYPFSWTSVPSYVGSGASMTGRWVTGSLQMTPISTKWKCTITFEKAN